MAPNILAAIGNRVHPRAMPAWSWPHGSPPINVTATSATPDQTAPFVRWPPSTGTVIRELPPIEEDDKKELRKKNKDRPGKISKRSEPPAPTPQWYDNKGQQPYWDDENNQYLPPDHDWPYVVNDADHPFPTSQRGDQYQENPNQPTQPTGQDLTQIQGSPNNKPPYEVQGAAQGQGEADTYGYEQTAEQDQANAWSPEPQPQGNTNTQGQPEGSLEDYVLIKPKDESKGKPYMMPAEEYGQKMGSMGPEAGQDAGQPPVAYKHEDFPGGPTPSTPPNPTKEIPMLANQEGPQCGSVCSPALPGEKTPGSALRGQGKCHQDRGSEEVPKRPCPKTNSQKQEAPCVSFQNIPDPDELTRDSLSTPQACGQPTQCPDEDLQEHPASGKYSVNEHHSSQSCSRRELSRFQHVSSDEEPVTGHIEPLEPLEPLDPLESLAAPLAESLSNAHPEGNQDVFYRCECFPIENS